MSKTTIEILFIIITFHKNRGNFIEEERILSPNIIDCHEQQCGQKALFDFMKLTISLHLFTAFLFFFGSLSAVFVKLTSDFYRKTISLTWFNTKTRIIIKTK